MPTQSFIVDASLLHELGERLIGRPAIALGELIKNAFDADATACDIHFGDDEIVVSDNGSGMSDEDFQKHWMRIGTTHKVDERISRHFKRSVTGSKGIGRLSVQFLANALILDSTPIDNAKKGVHAKVDWTTAISGNDLSTVTVKWDRGASRTSYAGDSTSGTRIALKGLKDTWSTEEIADLGNEVWMLRSPFKHPNRASTRTRRQDEFEIHIEAPAIEGAREAFDRILNAVLSNWKARVRGSLDHGRSGKPALVTVDFRAGYPAGTDTSKQFQLTTQVPVKKIDEYTQPLIDSVSFEILIFKTVGRQPAGIPVGDLREYLGKFGNVSVYDAGFRLPYYGSKRDKVGEDWLSIAADQGRRLNQSELLPERLRTQNKYMQDLPAPGRIFGAVDINTNHERRTAQRTGDKEQVYLQIQPGRDRLHDNTAFYQLRDIIRLALDFYANRFRLLSLEALERGRSTERPSRKFERALEALDASKAEIPSNVFRIVRRELADALQTRTTEEEEMDQRAALLAPLASAGMAALALNHEISRQASSLKIASDRLRSVAIRYPTGELEDIADQFREAGQRLGSLSDLFSPLISEVDRSATDRLRVAAVVEQAISGMHVLMPGVKFLPLDVPPDLRFPLASLAEWNALLQNVLANAWNAMLDSPKREVSFVGRRDGRGGEWLRVSDTGQGLGIPLSESPKLFEPFERRLTVNPDKRSIAIGGQGLGLAIVRMIARRRRADVAFVVPAEGFSTTFQISWRGVKP
jgi:signal transduction histidine kinase